MVIGQHSLTVSIQKKLEAKEQKNTKALVKLQRRQKDMSCYHAVKACNVVMRAKLTYLTIMNEALSVCRSQPLLPIIKRVVITRTRMENDISDPKNRTIVAG